MDPVSAFYATHPFWVWLAIGAMFLAIELVTGSGWLLWPAGSATLVGVVTLFVRLGPMNEVALFAASTIVTTYLGRRFLHRAVAGRTDINDPHSRLVGHHGEACAPFRGGSGRVFVDGKEWEAELDGDEDLTAGAKVKVTAVLGGACLKVKAA